MIGPTEPATHHRKRKVVLVLAVVLFAAGAAVIGFAIADQKHAPRPSPSAAGTIEPTTPPSSLPPSTAPTPAVPPISIAIPAIGVQSDIIDVGLNPDRTLEVPAPGPDYDKAAWYRYSPTPGQTGPSIIEGHIDSAANGPSVFFRLGALHPGDQVAITLADHTVVTYRIDGVREYPKNQFPTDAVYGNTDAPALRLITCGGSFDSQTQHYRDNIVVFASFVGRG